MGERRRESNVEWSFISASQQLLSPQIAAQEKEEVDDDNDYEDYDDDGVNEDDGWLNVCL